MNDNSTIYWDGDVEYGYGLTELLLKDVSSRDWCAYERWDRLGLLIAERYGIDKQNIVINGRCTNYISSILSILASTNQTLTVAFFVPSYSLIYDSVCNALNISKKHIFLDNKIGKVITDLRLFDNENSDVIIICNPNNPTGTLFKSNVINDLCSKYPNSLIIIDEAFIEYFYNETAISLISLHKNLVVIRSFSKMEALPGLWLGVCFFGDSDLAKKVRMLNGPYVSKVSSKILVKIIGNNDFYSELISKRMKEKHRLENCLKVLGFISIPTKMPFILISHPKFKMSSFNTKLRSVSIITGFFYDDFPSNPISGVKIFNEIIRITPLDKDTNDIALDRIKLLNF